MPIDYKNYNPNDLDIDDDSAIQPVGIEPPTPEVIGRPDQNLRKRTDHIKSVYNDHEKLEALERGAFWKTDALVKWYGPASESDLDTDDPTAQQQKIGTIETGADLVLIQPDRPDLAINVPASSLSSFFSANSPDVPGGATLQYRRRLTTNTALVIDIPYTSRSTTYTVLDTDLMITNQLLVVKSNDLAATTGLSAGMYIKNPSSGRFHLIASVYAADMVILDNDNPILPTEDTNAAGTYELYDTDGTTLLGTITSTTVMTKDAAAVLDYSMRLPLLHVDANGNLHWAFSGAWIIPPTVIDGTNYEDTRPHTPINDDRYTPTSQLSSMYLSKVSDDTTTGAITLNDDTTNSATRTMLSMRKSNAAFGIPQTKDLSAGVSAINNGGTYDPEYVVGLDPTAGGVSDPWVTLDVSSTKMRLHKDSVFDLTVDVAGAATLQSTVTITGLLTANGGTTIQGDLNVTGDDHTFQASTSSGRVAFRRDAASGSGVIMEVISDDGTGNNGLVDVQGTLKLGSEIQVGPQILIRNPSGQGLINMATDAKLAFDGDVSDPQHYLSSNTAQKLLAADLPCPEHGHTILSSTKFDFGSTIQSAIGSNPISVPTPGTTPVPSVDLSSWEIFNDSKYLRDYDGKIARVAGYLFWCKLQYSLPSPVSGSADEVVQTGSIILSLTQSIIVNGEGAFVIKGPKNVVFRQAGGGTDIIEHYMHGVLWNPLLTQYSAYTPTDPSYPESIIPDKLYYVFDNEVNNALGGSSPKINTFVIRGELYGIVM